MIEFFLNYKDIILYGFCFLLYVSGMFVSIRILEIIDGSNHTLNTKFNVFKNFLISLLSWFVVICLISYFLIAMFLINKYEKERKSKNLKEKNENIL